MKKPKAKTEIKTTIDYLGMSDYIEEKYQCRLRDFAAHKHGEKSSCKYNCDHREAWSCRNFPRLAEFRKNPVPNYGLNQEGRDFYATPAGSKWFDLIREAYNKAPDGKCKEIPYWDFWHFLIDAYDFHNGSTININWLELKSCCDTDWQKEICDLFIKEFGDKDMDVEFSW